MSVREPSDLAMSTAMPSATCLLRTSTGSPLGPFAKRVVHYWHFVGDRSHDGVADEVRERDLVGHFPSEITVDDLAIDF